MKHNVDVPDKVMVKNGNRVVSYPVVVSGRGQLSPREEMEVAGVDGVVEFSSHEVDESMVSDRGKERLVERRLDNPET